jgi:hypothetical protein
MIQQEEISMKRKIIYIVVVFLCCLCSCRPERPTPTTIPNLISNNPSNPNASSSDVAFHINFNMDESAVCSAGVKCDNAYVPKISMYFRGDIDRSSSGNLSGSGSIILTNAEPCQTLIPENSSCEVTQVTDGTFSITGHAEGNQLALTLQIIQMPTMQVIYTVKHPSGNVVLDLTTTYAEEFTKLFESAGVVDKEFTINSDISTTSSAINFEGTYTFGGMRTLHGFGGLIVINPDTPLPPGYIP